MILHPAFVADLASSKTCLSLSLVWRAFWFCRARAGVSRGLRLLRFMSVGASFNDQMVERELHKNGPASPASVIHVILRARLLPLSPSRYPHTQSEGLLVFLVY